MQRKFETKEEIAAALREHDINPTVQRLEIAQALFSRGEHVCAEELFDIVNADHSRVSKATVYNTMSLFVKKRLIRQVIADPARVFYDPNTIPHHHFFDVATGKLGDIDSNNIEVTGMPSLPEGAELEGVDVIVRVRGIS